MKIKNALQLLLRAIMILMKSPPMKSQLKFLQNSITNERISLNNNHKLFKETGEFKLEKQVHIETITRLEENVVSVEFKLKKDESHKVTKFDLSREKKYTSMMSKGSKDLTKVLAAQ